jgi:hypothetical protein
LLGDATIDGINIENYYIDLAIATSSLGVFVYPYCTPDEPKTRNVVYKNINASIWYPDSSMQLINPLAAGELTPNMISTFEFSNIYYHDIYGSSLWGLYIACGPQSIFYFHDSLYSNTFFNINMITPRYCAQITLENITFENTHGIFSPLVFFEANQNLVLRNIKLKNITGSNSPVLPIIQLGDFSFTSVEISGLFVEN